MANRLVVCFAGAVLAALVASSVHAQTCPTCVPLTDLGPGLYLGAHEGGLYTGGVNTPPPAHLDAAMSIASATITPRNASGAPDPDGLIVMLSIGMSNTSQEFGAFERDEDRNPLRNGRVVLLNAAVGGQSAEVIKDPAAAYWGIVDDRLAAIGATREQVQVVWLKQANGNPQTTAFPAHAQQLQSDLGDIVRVIKGRFENAALCYLSSRSYGGYSTNPLRWEPLSYETGFGVKWLIEAQISGDPSLNYNPGAGPVVAPLLLWGAYIWANGAAPRDDGFFLLEQDYQGDGIHPSPSGEQKISALLTAFFDADPTAAPWWPAQTGGARIVHVDAEADATTDAAQPSAPLGGLASLRARGDPSARAYLRFDLAQIPGAQRGPIDYAKLSLHAGPSGRTRLASLSDTAWDEATITHNNRPAVDGAQLAEIPLASRTWAADVTPAVVNAGGGKHSLAIDSLHPDPAREIVFRGRESGEPPRLVLSVRPCPGDLDFSGVVNGADLGVVLGAWGTANIGADLNADGVVNGADLGLLLGDWGVCP